MHVSDTKLFYKSCLLTSKHNIGNRSKECMYIPTGHYHGPICSLSWDHIFTT